MTNDKLIEENKKLLEILALKDAIIETERREKEFYKASFFNEQRLHNKLLSMLNIEREKNNIRKAQAFVAKTEKIDVVLNEVEEVIKDSKKNQPKRPRRKLIDDNILSKHYTETRYENPPENQCEFCGGSLDSFSEKENYEIEFKPATLKIIRVIKRTCKCPKCSKKENKIYYPLSRGPFHGSTLTPSFAAYIAYTKYELGVPFHHLEKHIEEVLRISISKQTLSRWMSNTALTLMPLYERLRADLLNNDAHVIHSDETTLVVSKRPDYDANRKKSYVYVYTTSYYDRQIQIYDFHESRSIDATAAWLKNYKGYIVCDDFAGYKKLASDNSGIKLQRCFAHARRRFIDILKSLPENQRKNTKSFKVIEYIDRLFSYEAKYKEKKLIAQEIVDRRRVDQIPILNKLEEIIFDTVLKPNTPFENAVNYMKKLWNELTTYLECGYLEISNNIAERAVRPFVINRKRFMTSGSYAGARYTTIIFSIIRCAIINNIDVQKYLIYVLENIECKAIEDLLPYSLNINTRIQ